MNQEPTSETRAPPALSSLPSNSSNQPSNANEPNPPPPPPPDLAPLSSPSPSPDKNDRFKGIVLPNGWLDCPLTFNQPLRDYRILVCKTPIDDEIAQYLAIPKEKQFAPHTIYTLPNKHYIAKQKQLNSDPNSKSSKVKKRKIGLVIDLTNQKYFDQISFNNGKKTNKVKLRVIAMENLSKPTDEECLEFCYLVKAFLDGTNNADSYIVVYDDLGFNLCGFMCCCFMVNELNYSVDAAVYTFAQGSKPGIFDEHFVRLLHEKYSDEEDQKIFEQMIKLKPLQKPTWLQQKNQNLNEFAIPTTSIRRKRPFSQISKPQKLTKSEQKSNDFSINAPSTNSSSILTEPQILQSPKSPKTESMPSASQTETFSSNIIMEPTLIGMAQPPPMKKQRICAQHDEREQMLKKDHSYLVSVRNEHLQHLTSIILQLSKSKDLFHSICQKTVTVPKVSLLSLAKNYRISWLGKGWNLWMMILGKKGCFFVDPYYFEQGKIGGIYHVNGTMFIDAKTNNAMDGTLCCGELVVDELKDKNVPRFLITDLLVLDKQSLSKFPHTERLQMAENKLYKKCAKSLQKSRLRIRVKPMYSIENEEILKKLEKMIKFELPHKNDGFGLFPINPPFGQRILRMAL